MFCPSCEDEFREGFTWCPDCDVALVESLPSEPSEPSAPPDSEDRTLVTVARYFSPIEAHSHRMTLEQAGLCVWVGDDATGATYGVAIGTALQVRAHDAEAARAILDADAPRPAEPARPNDRAEPADAGVADPLEPPQPFEALELVGMMLLTSVYPIVSDLLRGPAQPTEGSGLMADIPWFAGLTLVVWTLLRRGRQGPLAPKPMPRSAGQRGREIGAGVLLFLALYVVVQPVLGDVLSRVVAADDSSPWSSFLRQPGVAAVFSLRAFFAAAYEEVVFRAYLISRLSPRLGKAWAVLLGAALFALIHGYPLGAALMVFANGVGYGLVYMSSRSLPRLVAAHWLYNLAVVNHYL
jgi:membrane protease YdiL (CAAX protease family)